MNDEKVCDGNRCLQRDVHVVAAIVDIRFFSDCFPQEAHKPFDSEQNDFHGLAISPLNPACNVNA